MLIPLRPRVLGLALLVGIVAAILGLDPSRPQKGEYFFEVTVTASQSSDIQLFYDIGRGFNEEHSVRQPLIGNSRPVVYRFSIPAGVYRGIRFDPTSSSRPVIGTDAKIVAADGTVMREFSFDRIRSKKQIARITEVPAGTRISPHLGANDANLVFEQEPTFKLPGRLWAPRTLAIFGTIFIVVTALTYVIGAVYYGDVLGRHLSTLRDTSVKWPRCLQSELALLLAMAFAVAAKFWITADQTILAIGGAGHDDQLFIDLAANIAAGNWLGNYDQFTLMKGPMYSILMAITYRLGLPFFGVLELSYAIACALFIYAIKPALSHRGWRFAIFLGLLFNPVTYESVVNARILRQNLLPVLTLLILAALISIYFRHDARKRALFPWLLFLGLLLPTFWLTREESVWFTPPLILIGAAIVYGTWRANRPDRWSRFALLSLPLFLWFAGTRGVAWINLQHYGVFTTCEFQHQEFKDAYGALLRVKADQPIPYVATPRAVREKIYPVSPAFTELRAYLEGACGEGWARSSEGVTGIPPSELEIAGGWFMWALRDAVALAGHCTTGADAMKFYARMATEINAACDQGLLDSGPPRSGFLPPLEPAMLQPLIATFSQSTKFLIGFAEMHTGPQYSIGPADLVAGFARLTHGKVGPLPDEPRVEPAGLQRFRQHILAGVSKIYQLSSPVFGVTSFLVYASSVFISIARRKAPFFVVVATGSLGAVSALTLAVALIEVTSFPAINTGYFSGAYGVWLVFMATSFLGLRAALAAKPNPTPSEQSPREGIIRCNISSNSVKPNV
jgi:hypothetical protein